MKTFSKIFFLVLLSSFLSVHAQSLLAYDDNDPDEKAGLMDRYLGVRMSPAEDGEIVELQFDLSLVGESGQFEILLFDWTGSSPSSTPVYEFVARVEKSGLFSHKIEPPIRYSGEFVVGFRSLFNGLHLGFDAENNERGWTRIISMPGWQESDETFFIRGMVRTDSEIRKAGQASEMEMPNPDDDIIVIGTDGTITSIAFLDSEGNLVYEQDLSSGEPIEVTKLTPGRYLLLLYSNDELISTESVFIR